MSSSAYNGMYPSTGQLPWTPADKALLPVMALVHYSADRVTFPALKYECHFILSCEVTHRVYKLILITF